MSGFDVSEIADVIQEVIDDRNEEVEYCIFTVQTQPNKVAFETKGKGGLEEVKANLREDCLQFAYYRTISGDEESRRVKFVFISWAGDRITKPKLRAVMSILKGDVKTVINNFHIELHATSLDDLDEEEIATKIIKAGGANYSFNTSSS